MGIGSAGAEDPLIVGRQQAHRLGLDRREQIVEILAHHERRLAVDLHLCQPLTQSVDPGTDSLASSAQPLTNQWCTSLSVAGPYTAK